jgi:Peptidase family M1 domain
MFRHFRAIIVLLGVAAYAQSSLAVQPTTVAANADPIYQQVRRPTIGEAYSVSNVMLKRDAGTFNLNSGTLCFVQPINGRVTGAVFSGSGSFSMTPPTAQEKRSMSYLTRQPKIDEDFNELALRFGDNTYDELKNAPGMTKSSGGCARGVLDDAYNAQKKQLHSNISIRILQDVLSPNPGGYFTAFIKGKKYDSKLLYTIDPHGVLAPEEVALMTYGDNKEGVWASFHLAPEYLNGTALSSQRNRWTKVEKQVIDARIEKNGRLAGKTTTTLVAKADGLRVARLGLYRTLRVSSVTDASGTPLNFIQEDKDEDPQFAVILPQPLKAGDKFTVVTTYEGKDAILNEGSGNYMVSPAARDDWYTSGAFDDYTDFEMHFTYPKDLQLVASGVMVGSEHQENGMKVSDWKSEAPQTVACFQLGKFKEQKKSLTALNNFEVETFANTETPDIIRGLQHAVEDDAPGLNRARVTGYAFGNFNTTSMAQKAMAEGELAEMLYNDYFGPSAFKRLALTQQTADNFGQSWPGLVWLPITYFFDSTVRHQLGMDDTKGAYFTVVGPHEIAHQWWGHTLTWSSYRDQWMSEGFADFSASLFLQLIEKNPQKFIKFWNDQRDFIVEKNKEGFRAIDAGPVTMGYRANNSKTGFDISRRLIYPKGAYILHMIRMMMWNNKDGDGQFKEMMRDFVKTYYNKPVSTEEFKAIVEKHMLPQMDVTGDHKMDWFFDPFVYGTALPNYKLTYNLTNGQNGPVMDLSIAQSNVDDRFQMIVPVYLELANGRVIRLGNTLVAGNNTKSEHIELGKMGLKDMPKKVYINYYDDVLSTSN